MSDIQNEVNGERRTALKIIGAIGTTCAFPFSADELYGQHVHEAAKPPAPAGPYTPVFFKPAEYALVGHIADLIIPQTETPGATASGVPQYIDNLVSKNEQHQPLYREGLALVDSTAQSKFGKKFLELDETRQIELLLPWSEAVDRNKLTTPGAKFFKAIKSMTADGYYTSYAGLVQELGYKGNVALAAFPECTHEH